MAIDFSRPNGTQSLSTTTLIDNRTGAAHAQSSSTASTQRGDEVYLSNSAQHMQKLAKNLSQDAEIREDQVAGLKMAIEQGSYRVDSVQLADTMMQFESEL